MSFKIRKTFFKRFYIFFFNIISLLNFLVDKSDDLSLAEALRSPLFGLSESKLYTIAHKRTGKLFDSLVSFSPDHSSVMILEDLLKSAHETTPFEIIQRILIKHHGRVRLVTRLGDNINNTLDEFLEQALHYENLEPPHLSGFLDWFIGTDATIKRDLPNCSKSKISMF